jgi:hypothetical protein
VVTKGRPYDDRSAHRGIGDFGIPVFHRPGWPYRPQASALNRVRDGSVPPNAHRLALRRYRLLISEPTVPSLWPRAPASPGRDPRRGGIRGAHAEGESNSITRAEDSVMTSKAKRNVTLEPDARPIQPHSEDTSGNHAPSHEEIRRRAYEIYLERNGLAGDALDDWLRAERELQKVALFKRGWNRLEERRPDSEDGN